jgi:2-polyprenyl-6-hydroxyphenyl methylase/3-demethylubiquinone-9 3-methyltransferase
MHPDRARAFAGLGRLDRATAAAQSIPCKLCATPAAPFDVVDFAKSASRQEHYPFGLSGIAVPYHRCPSCGFLFTAFFDDWSVAEFAAHVYNDDYIKVDPEYRETRPLRTAEQMVRLLDGCREARILDYGSGTGAFAAAMRAGGFARIEAYDPFSNPVRPEGRFDLITCFEVIEHTPSPVAALAEMASLLDAGGAILFSQSLQPADIGRVRGGWWYVAPRNGHVSTFTPSALAVLAARSGFALYTGQGGGQGGLHAMTAAPGRFAAAVVSQIGKPFVHLRLLAPEGRAGADWHAVEGTPGRRFRWTRAAAIAWEVRLPDATPNVLRVEVPFANEVRPNFAAACRIELAGVAHPVAVETGRLVATFETACAGACSLALRTPPPMTPASLREAATDRRELGLAIRAAP